jgi:hypothetical protein
MDGMGSSPGVGTVGQSSSELPPNTYQSHTRRGSSTVSPQEVEAKKRKQNRRWASPTRGSATYVRTEREKADGKKTNVADSPVNIFLLSRCVALCHPSGLVFRWHHCQALNVGGVQDFHFRSAVRRVTTKGESRGPRCEAMQGKGKK